MTISSAIAYLILIGGLAIVIFVLSLLLHGFDSLNPDISRHSSYKTNSSNEDQANSNPIAAAITAYNQSREASDRQNTRQGAITIRVITATGIFAALAAGAAIFSGFVSLGQFQQVRRSADIAKETAERQLRAYIGVLDISMQCRLCDSPPSQMPRAILPDQWKENMVTITVKNGGITPAFNVIGRDGWHYVPYNGSLPKDFDFPVEEEIDPERPYDDIGMLSPGEKSPSYGSIRASVVPLIVRARRYEITLFYYGDFTYTDIFEIPRKTPFCFRYIPDFTDYPFVGCGVHNTPKKSE